MDELGRNKRIVKNSFFLYIRTFFVLLLSLYTTRFLLNILGVEDYGIYNIVAGMVIMLGFLNQAMSDATQRFFSFEIGKKNIDGLRGTFQTSLFIHIMIGLIIFLLAETVGLWFINTQINYPSEKSTAVNWLYQASIFTFLVSVVQVPFQASLIAHEHFKFFSLAKIAEYSFKMFAVLALGLFLENKLVIYGFLLLILTSLTTIAFMMYAKKHFSETSFNIACDKNIFKDMLGYTSWSLFGSTAHIVSTEGINILLNLFFGPLLNAAMGVSIQVQTAVRAFVSSLQMAINPQIVKSYAENKMDYMKSLIYLGTKYSFFLLMLVAIPLVFETKSILDIWLKNVPDYSVVFTRLIVIVIVIDSLAGPIRTTFQATGKIKRYQIIVGTLIMCNVPVSYLFLKQEMPPEMVLHVSITLSIIAFFIRLALLKAQLSFSISDYFFQIAPRTLAVFFITASSLIIVNDINNDLLRLGLLILIEIIFFIISLLLVGLTKKEKKVIYPKLKNILKKSNFKKPK